MYVYVSGGLFNDLSQKPSQKAFENLVRLNGNMSYHGRSLYSKTVDSYSTALECKFGVTIFRALLSFACTMFTFIPSSTLIYEHNKKNTKFT